MFFFNNKKILKFIKNKSNIKFVKKYQRIIMRKFKILNISPYNNIKFFNRERNSITIRERYR
jgi:hypothetical protein